MRLTLPVVEGPHRERNSGAVYGHVQPTEASDRFLQSSRDILLGGDVNRDERDIIAGG